MARGGLRRQRFQQLRLNLDLRLVLLQLGSVDQKSVFYAFAQGGDFGGLQVDVVLGQ